MTTDEINRNNLSVAMPCEYHDYQESEDGLRRCQECGMISFMTAPTTNRKEEK